MSIFSRKEKRAQTVHVKIDKYYLELLDVLYPHTKTDAQKIRDAIVGWHAYNKGMDKLKKNLEKSD